MNKILSTLILMLFFIQLGYCTHNRGGYISYKHISGLTYEATITTYTDNAGPNPVDRNELLLDWGDGNTDTVTRNQIVQHPYSTQENKYTGTHTYSSIGDYIITMEDAARNSGILNYNNSDTIAMFLSSKLVINSNTVGNNSPSLLGQAFYVNQVNSNFKHNVKAFEEDGDHLHYLIVNCKGSNGQEMIPSMVINDFTVNELTGELNWQNPSMLGEFLFTIRIVECRNGQEVGFINVDVQVQIASSLDSYSTGFNNLSIDSNGNYSITVGPNNIIEFRPYVESISGTSNNLNIAANGGVFNDSNTILNSIDSSSSNSYLRRKFRWITSDTNIRCAPYRIYFSSNYAGFPLSTNTVLVYVHDSTIGTCNNNCNFLAINHFEEINKNINVTVFPNPFSESTMIKIQPGIHSTKSNIIIYNISGKVVRTIPVNGSNNIQLNRDELSSGFYIYSLQDEGRVLASGKFIIE